MSNNSQPQPQWTANPAEVENLKKILSGATTGNSQIQAQMMNQLELYSKVPEYNNYLSFIFAASPSSESALRSVAGLSLKNNLRAQWSYLDPSVLAYCKYCVLQALSDPDAMIRKVAGSIITTCVSGGLIERWPEVLPKLIELTERPETIVGAFGALEKICEDSCVELEEKDSAFVGALIQKLLVHIENPNAEIRSNVLKCTNQFLMIRSAAIWDHLDAYMNILYKCCNDPAPSVKRYVCQAFNNIVELKPDVLVPVLDSVISFMLHVMQQDDKESGLEAADFFLIFSEQDTLQIHIQQFLPRILPVLLKCMVYSEDEIMALEAAAEEDAHIADRDQDIQPRFHKGKVHELEGEKIEQQDKHDSDEDSQDDEDYDADDFDEWNIRKCSAASVDMLSTVFQDDLLNDLLPTVNQMLSANEWQVKEAGILALGAIAQGSASGMEQHLPQLVPHLVSLLAHEKALVRSITCWTLGRYAGWIVTPPYNIAADPAALQNHINTYFVPFLQGVLQLCLSTSKEVQKSACSTLAILEEEAGEKLVPYLAHIIETISRAFSMYQKKNMLILFDAFSTLADSVGDALNRPEFIEKFMPPILAKWAASPDTDYDLFPLLECLSSVAIALGHGFLPFASAVWQRSISLIKATILACQQYNADSTLLIPDKDFIVVSLDLISGIVQGLGPHCEQLVVDPTHGSLYDILKFTMRDETPDVRSSSFALLGDLAASCYPTIIPHMNDIMMLVVGNLNYNNMDSQCISAMNNAAWSSGEIAIRHQGQMEPYVNPLMAQLVPILIGPSTPRSLKENAAITLGRIGLVCPHLVAPHLDKFIQKWCEALGHVHDNAEKLSAFRGICKLIQANPQGLVPFFEVYCDAVLKWNVTNQPEVKHMFMEIFTIFRNAMGDKWSSTLATFAPHIQQRMREVYGL